MRRHLVFKWIGIALTAIGAVSLFGCYTVLSSILNRGMSLSPSSKTYEMWKKPPIPVVMNFYLFNCTNPDQALEKNYKPEVVQLGPYSFNQVEEKVNITWNRNHTVTYRQVRRWYFDPENSNGSLNDNVTTLNVVPVSTSSITRNWNNLLLYPVSTALNVFVKSVWVTKPVSEFLFDGFTDPLLSAWASIPGLSWFKVPVDRAGFMYGRNDSALYDGVFNVDTGTDDVTKRGILCNWNYKNRTSNDGEYGDIRGSIGEFFPPVQTKETNLELFIPDFCRTVQLGYSEEVTVRGINGYRYVMSKYFVDNGASDPSTVRKFEHDCLPQGVLNVTACHHGAPAFISSPHFFNADPYYVSQMSGLQPEADKHQFYITLEPTTGTPLEFTARFQMNLLLQPNPRISMFAGVPKILFPMMWAETRASITPELANLLGIYIQLPTVSVFCSVGLLLMGLLTLGLTFLPQIVRAVSEKNHVSRRDRSEDSGTRTGQAEKQTTAEEITTLLHT